MNGLCGKPQELSDFQSGHRLEPRLAGKAKEKKRKESAALKKERRGVALLLLWSLLLFVALRLASRAMVLADDDRVFGAWLLVEAVKCQCLGGMTADGQVVVVGKKLEKREEQAFFFFWLLLLFCCFVVFCCSGWGEGRDLVAFGAVCGMQRVEEDLHALLWSLRGWLVMKPPQSQTKRATPKTRQQPQLS